MFPHFPKKFNQTERRGMLLAELKNVLSRLSRIFKSSEIDYVIVGGIVVNYYGHIRATQDIDIIIEDN